MNYINSNDTIQKNDKKVWITLSPDYGNIGDIAISIVQQKIISDVLPNRKIVEVPMIDYYDYKEKMKELISNDDIITIIGGRKYGKYIS